MIQRQAETEILWLLEHTPAVVVIGPRQAGKTTLALQVGSPRPSVYLDLESAADRAKLAEPELYLADHADELVILDEIQRVPGLFETLRGVIDRGRREGRGSGRFLLAGSASIDLLAQSGETLAGRVAFVELGPVGASEVETSELDRLWVRGGFPESFLARGDAESMRWRRDFIRTYLDRHVPELGPRVPAETLRRLWTMLAHRQGAPLNAAQIAAGLGVSGQTVARYLDLMVDLLLVRRLPPALANIGKRLVRSPRVYVRDSGLVHALLGLGDKETVLGHPVAGASWEGLAVESLIAAAGSATEASFYRTSGGAEVDLVLDLPGGRRLAIEVKRTLAPKVSRGLRSALEDLSPQSAYIVYAGEERYALTSDVEAIALPELCKWLADESHATMSA